MYVFSGFTQVATCPHLLYIEDHNELEVKSLYIESVVFSEVDPNFGWDLHMLSVKANSLSVGANMNWTGAAGNADSDRDRNADSFFFFFFGEQHIRSSPHVHTCSQLDRLQVCLSDFGQSQWFGDVRSAWSNHPRGAFNQSQTVQTALLSMYRRLNTRQSKESDHSHSLTPLCNLHCPI